ncbi:MAG: type VI secretion system tube protein Hcp [Azoarcus sp.]|jgi:type VI secretion system secreted protein Hcp|nr:type VI secretion system tube protein Hcp [Azoarcus sp.]
MAFDVFVQIDGIPGESLDAEHKDWIEVLSFEHSMEQPASASASSAGGATAERANHKPFVFVHEIDKASPKLAEALCRGNHIKEITFVFRRAGGSAEEYYKVILKQTIVSHLKSLGTTDKVEGGFPREEVWLSYGSINWVYTQQKRDDGAGGGSVASGWSRIENKAC